MLMHVTNLSACGLGQSVANPMKSGLAYFPEEFEAGIREAVAPVKGGLW